MADSKMRYCRLCNGPCEGRSICLQTPDRFKPSANMIKTALVKQGAFKSHAFLHYLQFHQPSAIWSDSDISSDMPDPEFSVIYPADGGCEVSVRLKWMHFLPEYRDPRSPERRELEKAAREEIIRSLSLPRSRVRDGDIEVVIREGTVGFLFIFIDKIIELAGKQMDALVTAGGDAEIQARNIRKVGFAAASAIFGAAVGAGVNLMAMGVGGAIGYVVGTVFADKYLT
ncbi:PREDICTED: uncharacterized protein LOC109472940 [Branchiostoma belcheri]|uniref:Uncharacterized protein LOC109472940 n=1 Tax=Branchiostoma belcheri TaxID=7741 RepID=A0A6P4Z348_BRABE|nr:PREDICTED: uncharacterized protein LOC109472940 [Branchiostoma belcheri]